jgi:hypothetical protein
MMLFLMILLGRGGDNGDDTVGEEVLIGQSLYTSCFFFWFYPFRRQWQIWMMIEVKEFSLDSPFKNLASSLGFIHFDNSDKSG